MSVKSVKAVIIKQARTKKPILTEWNKRNFARAVTNTPFIGKQSNLARLVAQLARAPVSKTGGCGFESLQACFCFAGEV